MSRTRLVNKHSLMGKLGSFWGQSLTPASLTIARRLAHFVDHTSALGDLQSIVDHAAAEERLPFEHKTVSFEPSEVIVMDEELQERIRFRFATDVDDGYSIMRLNPQYMTQEGWTGILEEFGESIIITEGGALLLFPDDSPGSFFKMDATQPIFSLLIPPDLVIESIEHEDRLMLCGVDFYHQPGLLVFHERPDTLFPDRRLLVRSGYTAKPCLFNYTLSLDDNKGAFAPVTDYMGGNLSSKAFERAIATAAGLKVTAVDLTVLSVRQGVGSAMSYSTTEGILDVEYAHEALVEGQFIPKGTVIGGAVRVLSLENSSGAWWRATNWSAGMSLDPVCSVKGLTAPDAPILVDAVEQTGADIHARLHFLGEPANLARFWTQNKQNEVKLSRFLNEVVGLSDVNDKKRVNAIDFLFENLFGIKSIVVELQTRSLGDYYHNRALAFIHREKPVNVVTIINEV